MSLPPFCRTGRKRMKEEKEEVNICGVAGDSKCLGILERRKKRPLDGKKKGK